MVALQKLDLSKRQRTAETRRRQVLESGAFQEWWSARQNIHPIPSDPFRAFMIDIGLVATVHSRLIWQGRTNRADYPPVDLPSHVPSHKRRMPSRKQEARFKRMPMAAQPYLETSPLEKELETLAESMAERYHVPKPRIRFERREGALTSSYWAGQFGGFEPFIKIGVKGRSQPQIFGAFEHEFGHHAHAKKGLSGTSGVSEAFRSATRIEMEEMAWTLADPFMKQRRQEQKWLKQFALGTYTGKAKSGTTERSYGIRLQPLRIRGKVKRS